MYKKYLIYVYTQILTYTNTHKKKSMHFMCPCINLQLGKQHVGSRFSNLGCTKNISTTWLLSTASCMEKVPLYQNIFISRILVDHLNHIFIMREPSLSNV